ncbi:uncharacterized protein LOC114818545, partial [Antrostomus carolinensis]|uniref:uncharacterized protein LOC114818545 n=1 Tax=Antrostomus carolinensis TaxID=279965 RepID=UPI0010A99104
MRTGESGLTVFRLLTKENRWKWVQANARLVYKNGKPEYIVVTQRPLVDEEGGEHLRQRSVHLPFTFATGEALLYQNTYPLPGSPSPFQSKGKASKSKKTSQSDRGCSQKDDINPSSLLGAVMQQDQAVYVSHPAPHPSHSFSSRFMDHLEDVSLLDAGGDAWSMGAAPVSSRGDSLNEELVDLQQDHPLLAILDSLSIKNDESCSNNELFSVLEGLGLNAEDLELLLLDEKTVKVHTDPDHIPSLNDCLASNEILSYIHTRLVNKYDGGQQVCPLPGPSSSSCGGTATYQAQVEDKDSQYLPQHVAQPSIALGQPPAPLWEQPLHTTPGQLPPPVPDEEEEEEEEPCDGLQWRPAEEEGLPRFLQPRWATSWDKAPGSPPGTPCPWEPPGAQQLEGDFVAVHPTQEDAHGSFSLPSQCQGHVGPPSRPKHRPLLMNRLCGHSPDSAPHLLPSSSPSPWQDYVSPLLGSPVQTGFYGISQELISQQQGCVGAGPGVPRVQFNLDGLRGVDTAGSRGSQEEMAPYSRCFPSSSSSSSSSYQLIPEKQPSPVPSMPQRPFPSSSAERCGSPWETPVNPYGTFTSTLSQESRHKGVIPAMHCLKVLVFPPALPWDSLEITQCWWGAWFPPASHIPRQKRCQITLTSPAVTSVSKRERPDWTKLDYSSGKELPSSCREPNHSLATQVLPSLFMLDALA